jgi:hypothetical protein
VPNERSSKVWASAPIKTEKKNTDKRIRIIQ